MIQPILLIHFIQLYINYQNIQIKMSEFSINKNSHENSSVKLQTDQKWRKLEQKYKQYIALLKKKVDSYEQKFAIMSKESTTEVSNEQISKTMIIRLCFRIQNLKYKQLFNAFQKIKQFMLPKIRSNLDIKLPPLYPKLIKQENKSEKYISQNCKNLLKEKQESRMKLFTKVFCKHLHFFKILKYTFNKIKEASVNHIMQKRKKQLDIFNKLQKKVKLKLAVGFHYIKTIQYCTPKTLISCQEKINYLKHLLSFDQIVESLCHENKSNNYPLIYLQNCKLKREIEKEKVEIKKLKEQLTYRILQREKDMIKKSEGLQQLADELREKDELILQYQRQLQVHKKIKQNKILILSATDYQIQKRRLEDINQRLNEQIQFQQLKLESQKQKYEAEINKLKSMLQHEEQQKSNILNQLEQLKQYKFENEYQKVSLQVEKEKLVHLQNNLNKRQSHLCYQLRQCCNSCDKCNKHSCKQKNNTGNDEHLKQVQHFQVISIIQRFLNGDFSLSLDCFRDETMIDRLNQIKYNIQSLKQTKLNHPNHMIRIPSKSKLNQKATQDDQVLILKNSGDALKQVCQFFEPIKVQCDNQTNLQLQNEIIENCKKIEMKEAQQLNQIHQLKEQTRRKQQTILGLKQKLMYIRQNFLQFLKSLHLENSLSKQSKEILYPILQFFEYSQVERKGIFGKRKVSFFSLFE